MASMKKKVAAQVKLPPELEQFDPWDGWFDRAYDEATTSHDSSSLSYRARILWKNARIEAGAVEHPLLATGLLREQAHDFLVEKGHDPEVWYA